MNQRNRFERFCFKHRDKGIPNLMLYIVIGNAIVSILSLINGGDFLYLFLCFNKDKILDGQVWRLFTFVFTDTGTDLISLLFLYFFYLLGRHVEQTIGTFKFNLFYLSGVVLMDIYAMIFCPSAIYSTQAELEYLISTIPVYYNMAYYLHLSLLLAFATMFPDSQFLMMFVVPIKGWIIAIIYLALISIEVINLSYPTFYFPHNLFPLVGIANYLLFMGKDMGNAFGFSKTRHRSKPGKKVKKAGPIPFPGSDNSRPAKEQSAPYTHKCTVCGRTDLTNPELEFRYCSRCSGYHCYCQDHISNHEHID